MWLNYNHLQYFWHVAREGSIAAAGRSLHVGVPSISAQLKQLEAALGLPLFRRRGRRLELTESGRLAYEYADEIFSRGQELLAALAGDGGRRALVFRVGVVDVVPKSVAWRLLRPALERDGALRLVCREGAFEELLGELARHRLDLVLSDGPIPREVDVRAFAHRLGESGTTFFGTPDVARRLRRRFPASLHGAPMLLPGARTALRRSLDDWFDDHGVRPEVVGEFDDSALLKVAGSEGFGVFAAPTAAESDVRASHGVAVVGRAPDCVERFYAVTGERRLQHPAALAIAHQARGAFLAERAK
ncbi:MAG: transcriptional activator NhaR [Myxococcales bacterium]|nr:transcriptional activator NhaR [Myxococcales bacterium]